MFSSILGNEPIKQYLERLITNNRVAHSLLFAGMEGIGKSLFASTLAKHLLGSLPHPDFHLYKPEGKTGMHAIEAMRHFSEAVYMAPFQGDKKVFIIEQAERMLPASANALLKTFEEPAADSFIILISSQPNSLIPTIKSRCHTLYFQPLTARESNRKSSTPITDSTEMENSSASQWMLDLLAKGKFSQAKQFSEAAEELEKRIEQSKKKVEQAIKAQKAHIPVENLTAVQKESINKEVEGAMMLHQIQQAQQLFDLILGWYRDMTLMACNGNRAYLNYPHYASVIEQSWQRGEYYAIETIQKMIEESRLSLERSTPLALCLQNLFLKIF